MMWTHRRIALWSGLGLFLAIALLGVAIIAARSAQQAEGHSSPVTAADQDAEPAVRPISVVTIRPKLNERELVRSVTQPAYVRGFYRADLMAHVAGSVKAVHKNIGDAVAEGEVLVELDVPDLVQEVAQKEALIRQAEQDARAAEANVAVMTSMVKVARSQIQEKQAQVERAAATRKYRDAEFHRFQQMAERKAVVESVVDERLRDFEAAEADWKSTQADVETARANQEEFSAKLTAARVDVDVKKARIAVAQAARDTARAMLEYVRIRAPFVGKVAARHVDPGAFVQNASTGHPTSVLTIVRTDLITVVVWVPEKDAPLVHAGTEVLVQLDALGDEQIHAKVSRTSDWLDPEKSRDMRVEVDLDNHDGRLKPGMYGTMTLLMQRFDKTYLVPAGAVFDRGGQTYIFEVNEAKAHLVPVRVQLEDGVVAKIVERVRRLNPKTGRTEETSQELTGQEAILRSGQGEIADGQAVAASPMEW